MQQDDERISNAGGGRLLVSYTVGLVRLPPSAALRSSSSTGMQSSLTSTWASAKMEEGNPSHAKHDQVASDSTHTHIPLQYSLATRNFVPDRLVRIVQRPRCV